MTKSQYNITAPSPSDGQPVEPQCDSRGNLKVALFASNGTSAQSQVLDNSDAQTVGSNGLLTIARNSVFNGTTWDRLVKPNAVSRLASSAATNNATSAKASAGNLFTVSGVNTNAAARYLKFYNKASAPNPAADTPYWVIYCPPSTVNGGMFQVDFGAMPLYFSTGIAWATVTGSGDTDNTAVGAGDLLAIHAAYA